MEILSRRIPFVLIVLGILSAILIGQLVSFQFRLNPSISEFEQTTLNRAGVLQRIQATRGEIYDRDGVVLAVNAFQYRVGLSPSLVVDRREAATQLATILNLNEANLYRDMLPDQDGIYTPYILLPGLIDDATARQIEDAGINGIIIEPVALRTYPQGDLMAQVIGFVNYSEQGFYGVEGKYDRQLAGNSQEIETVDSPFNIDELPDASDGQSLMLTVDRDVQFVVKDVLFTAIREQEASGGTIIVMNPRTGEILGMYSCPSSANPECDDLLASIPRPLPPTAEGETPVPPAPETVLYNPAIEGLFEPGSIIKVVSAAVALEARKPGLDIYWTYFNTGCTDELGGGIEICNWNRRAAEAIGETDFTTCIVESYNTCTATWYATLGRDSIYPRLQAFGFGAATGIDLEGEADGILRLPGSTLWSEADMLSISFGQAISVTPLQMLNAVNVIANDGYLMQPHIVKQRVDGNRVYEVIPNQVTGVISPEVADTVTGIMVKTVQGETLDAVASLPGYTVAGKTGTAQKPDFSAGGYSQTESWASFVGFLPADDPIVSAIIILDRPRDYWGSAAAAPYFRMLMERLVVLLEIPPDAIRLELDANGGNPFARD